MKNTTIFTFHYCDAWKSHQSMSMAEGYYPNTEQGRARLFAKLEKEIKDGSVELNGYDINTLRQVISCGGTWEANSMIEYGYINALEPAE